MTEDMMGRALARHGAAAAERLRRAAPRGTVAVLSPSPAAVAVAARAAAALGVPLLPLDPALPEDVVQSLLAQAGATVLVAEAPRAGLPWVTVAELLAGPAADSPPPSRLAPDDIALMVATSGSTGAPKAVMLSAGALAASAAASQARTPLRPGDRWLACLPLFHIGGFSILVRCAQAGAEAVLQAGFDARAVWHAIAHDGITHVSLVPAMLAQLIELADTPPPPTLRHVLVGGAALDAGLAERGVRAGWPLQPTYGMSETASQIATLAGVTLPWQAGHVGAPLPGVEIALHADGRLKARGPMLMAGYANAAGRRGDGLVDGWFVTNDLVELRDDGELQVLGRADDVIVSGGKKVLPARVEDRVARCPGVTAVAVAGRPDPVWGAVVTAVYSGAPSPEALLAWCREQIPGAERPRAAVRVATLPRLANGKPDRRAIQVLAGGAA